MLINCYYYAPHNHCLLSEHIKSDLNKMVELGTDIVSFCVQESQLDNWHWKRIDNFIQLAHEVGLKVHAVPNRWAGLFAGWIDGYSRFSMTNQSLLPEQENGDIKYYHDFACCVNKPQVREYIFENLEMMLNKFEFDGIIWDEPHHALCQCKYCKSNGINNDDDAIGSLSTFIDTISRFCKEISNREFVVSLFAQPPQKKLIECLLSSQYIDYFGSDGHLRSETHEMHRMKGTIFQAYDAFNDLIKTSGKKTLFLIEGQRHRDEDLKNYLENLDKGFDLPMDHLMYYFSAHEMSPENEAIFNRATWAKIKSLTHK